MTILNLVRFTFKSLSFVAPRLAARTSMELLFWARNKPRQSAEMNFWLSGESAGFASGCKGRIFCGSDISRGNVWVVHGWQSKGSRFKKLIETLTAQGFRVVAWEGPGHGDSPGRRTHLAEFSRFLHQDISASPMPPNILVGHSFGGASAAYVCKLGISADSLILIASPASASGVFKRYWDFISLGSKARRHFKELAENECQITLDELSADTFVTGLSQKILLVHDESDRLVPCADSETLKALKTDVDLLKTASLGHHRIVDAPEVISKISQFISRSERFAV